MASLRDNVNIGFAQNEHGGGAKNIYTKTSSDYGKLQKFQGSAYVQTQKQLIDLEKKAMLLYDAFESNNLKEIEKEEIKETPVNESICQISYKNPNPRQQPLYSIEKEVPEKNFYKKSTTITTYQPYKDGIFQDD